MKSTRRFVAMALAGALGCSASRETGPPASTRPQDVQHDGPRRWQTIATYAGHEERVGFRGGPDGRTVDWTSVGTLLLRDAWSGKSLAVLASDTEEPEFVVFSSDASRLLLGGADHAIELWDAREGKHLASLGALRPGRAPVVARDNLTALAFVDERVRVYDLSTGMLRHTLAADAGRLGIAADGTRGMIGDELWDLERGALIATLDGFLIGDHGFSFSPDSQFVLATHERDVRLWRASDGKPVWHVPAPPGRERDGAFFDGAWWGPTSVVVSFSRVAGLYGLAQGDLRATFDGPETVAFSPDGARVALRQTSSLDLYDANRGQAEQSWEVRGGGIWFADDGRLLVDGPIPDGTGDLEATSIDLGIDVGRATGRVAEDGAHLFVDEQNVRGRRGAYPRIIELASSRRVGAFPEPRFHDAAFVDEERLLAVGDTTELWAIVDDKLERKSACTKDTGERGRGESPSIVRTFNQGERALVAGTRRVLELSLDGEQCREIRRLDFEADGFVADLALSAGSIPDLTDEAARYRGGYALRPDGTGFAAWGMDGFEPVLGGPAQDLIEWPGSEGEPRIAAASWTTDGTQLALLDAKGDLWLWQPGADSLRVVRADVPRDGHDPRLTLAGPYAFVSTGKAVHAVAFQEGSTREPRSIPLAVHATRSQDGKRIAVAIRERGVSHVRVYATEDLTELVDVTTPLGDIQSVALSPSGERIMAVGGGMVLFEHRAD